MVWCDVKCRDVIRHDMVRTLEAVAPRPRKVWARGIITHTTTAAQRPQCVAFMVPTTWGV